LNPALKRWVIVSASLIAQRIADARHCKRATRAGAERRGYKADEVSRIHPVRDTLRFFKLMQRYRKL
jgi:hypothetical protein